jgi:hypothetical protein
MGPDEARGMAGVAPFQENETRRDPMILYRAAKSSQADSILDGHQASTQKVHGIRPWPRPGAYVARLSQ